MGMCALYEGALPALVGSTLVGSWLNTGPTSTGQFTDGCDPWKPNWAGRPLYRPRDNLAMLHGGEANAHVNEEHVVEQPPTVMVIDDDPGVRDSLGKLLRSAGLRVSLHGSGSEFLPAGRPEGPTLLVLDLPLPGPDGTQLPPRAT